MIHITQLLKLQQWISNPKKKELANKNFQPILEIWFDFQRAMCHQFEAAEVETMSWNSGTKMEQIVIVN